MDARHSAVAADDNSGFCRVTTGNAVRILFTNPLCALITANADGTHNGMTVSWLTPSDNHATFLMALNKFRHTRANLTRDAHFSLSVAVEGMETMLLALASESGKDETASGGKLARLGFALVTTASDDEQRPKLRARVDAAWVAARSLPSLAASPARLLCRVRSELTAGAASVGATPALGQSLLLCEILEAWVRTDHWVQNKLFVTPRGAPRLLCFQGSGVFAAIETRTLPPLEISSLQVSTIEKKSTVDGDDHGAHS